MESEVDTENLSQEKYGDAFEKCGAVLISGSTDGQDETGNFWWQVQDFICCFQSYRQSCIGGSCGESIEINFAAFVEELVRTNFAKQLQEERIDDQLMEYYAADDNQGKI